MIIEIRDFEHWREIARRLVVDGVSPHVVTLRDVDDQLSLFADEPAPKVSARDNIAAPKPFTVPREFLTLAQDVAYHSDPSRWNTLYRTLWRLQHDEPHLLELTTDDDVYQLRRMEKQTRRDAHKMKAFVRFRKVTLDGVDYFIAWHRSDHYVLRKVAPFFSRRFRGMNWSILTPFESVTWDQQVLRFGPGVARSEAPDSDEMEDLWRTYYSSIFNPARVKVKAMKNEMPVRYWPTMPETHLIPDLLVEASSRMQEMIDTSEGYETTAAEFIAAHEKAEQQSIESLDELAQLAAHCKSCDLHCDATQTVFGEGPATARLVIVGEQPGDVEDQIGRPFVGPAGEVLNNVLAAAGIRREDVYLTNVVKHFKHTVQSSSDPHELRGKRRLHKRPDAYEVRVCKPWLEAEWELLKEATVLVCLGSTAATALIAPDFKVSRDRGQRVASILCPRTIATWHPSAVLRTPGTTQRELKMSEMVNDLKLASELC